MEARSLDGKVFFTSNLTYNVSKFEDNVLNPDGSVLYNIKGKITPDSPKVIFQGGVNYEPVSWAIFNISAKYIGTRQTNFVNTEKLDGYTVVNAYVDLGDG